MKPLLASWLTLSCVAMSTSGCGFPNSSETEQVASAEARSTAPEKSGPSLELSKVTGYEVKILAQHGKPIGKEKSRVDEIEQWSLNSRGQVAFLASKDSAGGGYVASDLYFVDEGEPVHLATQRHEGEHTGRRFSRLVGLWLNEMGQVMVNGFRNNNREEVQLFLIEQDQITPLSINGAHLEVAHIGLSRPWRGRIVQIPPDFPELHFGPQRQLHYMAWNRQGSEPAAIYAGTPEKAEPIMVAANDPSDPLRQFSRFSAIFGTNARGQILFEASVGLDRYDGQRLFLYTPAKVSTKPETSRDKKPQAGSVREIARHGARLPETKITLANNNGHNVWHMAALSERGDVVMIAEVDRPNEPGVEEDCLFVLRPDKPWKMVAAADGHLGDVKLPIRSVTHPTINARGQVAFVAQFMSREDFDQFDERLFRLEPDDTLTDMARIGMTLKSGEKLRGLSGTAPQILSGGQVVVEPTVDLPSPPDHEIASIVIADEGCLIEALRLPTQLPVQPEFGNLSIEEIQANDAGYIAVVYTNGSHADTLLLAKPKHQTK